MIKEKDKLLKEKDKLLKEVFITQKKANKMLKEKDTLIKEALITQKEASQAQMKGIDKISDVVDKVVSSNVTINTTNNISNKYNINNVSVFLNDNCKEAPNLVDFVNSIDYKVKDLEYIGRVGYVDGISKLLIDNLSEIDITKRPIHCSDIKRMSLYIKDKDEWKRDNKGHEGVRRAIKHVAHKNIQNIDKWKEQNPEHKGVKNQRKQKEFLSIMSNSINCDNDDKMDTKIIRNMMDTIAIDNETMNEIDNSITNKVID